MEQAKVGKKVEGKNKEYTKNGTAVIPVGFAIVPGKDDVSEGLVISDNEEDTESDSNHIVANGNQFVWVPVSKENFETEFVRHDFGDQNIADEDFVTNTAAHNKYYEPDPKTIDTEYTSPETLREVKEMYESVKANGGFYIGRYEAGEEGGVYDEEEEKWITKPIKVVCRKLATVYNSIMWGNSMNDEKGGAVELSRNFAGQNHYTNVKSTLCYGVQWDAVMRWIS